MHKLGIDCINVPRLMHWFIVVAYCSLQEGFMCIGVSMIVSEIVKKCVCFNNTWYPALLFNYRTRAIPRSIIIRISIIIIILVGCWLTLRSLVGSRCWLTLRSLVGSWLNVVFGSLTGIRSLATTMLSRLFLFLIYLFLAIYRRPSASLIASSSSYLEK